MTTDITELAQRLDTCAKEDTYPVLSPDECGALVEALEKAQRANAAQDDHINQQQDRIDQLEKGHQEAVNQINSWRRMAKQNIAEREKDISELEAARGRIAELESRTVTVKLLDCDLAAVQHMSGGSKDYCNGFVDGTQNAIRAMRSAGVDVREAE